ncbi:F-box protein CPR1-like [Bidens hawaiensis]|uniref:F-box protein CPR1-like n=1 Tax=Bidens hawaiensis TaxID=980011 RepID=UPI00404946AF
MSDSDVSFPAGVLEDILSRLPVKSLLQFRSVSKYVRALIDNPYFVNLHMQKSMETNRILYFSGDSHVPITLRNSSAVTLETPFELTAFPLVYGSCHGLICLSNGPDDLSILLWNPSTRKYKPIPEPLGDKDIIAFDQLGYDHASNDYKVVRLSCTDSTMVFRVLVYSLKLDAWQLVEQDFPSSFFPVNCYGQGVFVNGAVHWLVNQIPFLGKGNLICAFDLATRSFYTVPQPRYPNNFSATNLGKLDEHLCVICTHEVYNVDVWVMCEYGVKESWSKLAALSMDDMITRAPPTVKPLIYTKKGRDVLLEVHKQGLLDYDLQEKRTIERWTGDASHMCMFVYQETLVPLFRNAQVV